MSITLKEVFEGAGYNFEDLEDLEKVKDMLLEADDLYEEVVDKIDEIENYDPEREAEEARADYYIHRPKEEDW